jgi:hypothetical protein
LRSARPGRCCRAGAAGAAAGGAQLGEDGGELVGGFLAQRGALLGGLAPDPGEFGAQLLDSGPVVTGAALRSRGVGLGSGRAVPASPASRRAPSATCSAATARVSAAAT